MDNVLTKGNTTKTSLASNTKDELPLNLDICFYTMKSVQSVMEAEYSLSLISGEASSRSSTGVCNWYNCQHAHYPQNLKWCCPRGQGCVWGYWYCAPYRKLCDACHSNIVCCWRKHWYFQSMGNVSNTELVELVENPGGPFGGFPAVRYIHDVVPGVKFAHQHQTQACEFNVKKCDNCGGACLSSTCNVAHVETNHGLVLAKNIPSRSFCLSNDTSDKIEFVQATLLPTMGNIFAQSIKNAVNGCKCGGRPSRW